MADIKLEEADWGIYKESPLLLDRAINITATGIPRVIDINLLVGRVQLLPGAELHFHNTILLNYSFGFVRLAPRLDLLVPSPTPLPGQARPKVVMHGGFQALRLCISPVPAFQNAAFAAVPRPEELPGQQLWGGSLPQDGCSNATSAPLLQRCWAGRYLNIDLAFAAQHLDAVGAPRSANYILQLLGNVALCGAFIDPACLVNNSVLTCYILAATALNDTVSPQSAAGAANSSGSFGENTTGTAAGEEVSMGGGGGDGGPRLGIILPVVLGGLAAAALCGVAALLCRRRSSQALASASSGCGCVRGKFLGLCAGADPSAPPGAGAQGSQSSAERSASLDSSSGPWAGQAVSHQDAPPPPATAISADAPAAAAARAHSNSACAVPVTAHTPQRPLVRLDLRWGADVTVDAGRMRGAGAFGRVLEGSYAGRSVAVKVLHRAAQLSVRARAGLESLAQEVQVLSRCSHPNIVALLGACLVPPHACLVMELMDQSLEQLMEEHAGRMSLHMALAVARDVAQGLAYLHPTIVHRDLKPANVLLDEHGTAKLTDFGLARLHETVCATKHPQAGTAPYMAPECFDPTNTIITHKADMYSWAVVVWEMLAGQRPWQGQPQMAIAVAVAGQKRRLPLWGLGPARCPPRLRELLEECWDEEPRRRPSAEEVVKRVVLLMQQLDRGAAADVVSAPPPGPGSPTQAAAATATPAAGPVEAAEPGGAPAAVAVPEAAGTRPQQQSALSIELLA